MLILLFRKFDFQLSLLHVIHCLYLFLSNLLYNLSHFSLCNRMYAHLFLLLLLCLHLLGLLYCIHLCQLHFLLLYFHKFDRLLLLHQQVHFLFLALCNILCNLSHFSLCNRSLLHFYLCPFQLLVFLCLLLCNCIHLLFLVFLLHHLLLMLLLLHQKFDFQLSLLHVIHCLYLFLSNLLCNLNQFSLCNRSLFHLCLFLLLMFLYLLLHNYIHLLFLVFLLHHL